MGPYLAVNTIEKVSNRTIRVIENEVADEDPSRGNRSTSRTTKG
jgi:hypothetical protein